VTFGRTLRDPPSLEAVECSPRLAEHCRGANEPTAIRLSGLRDIRCWRPREPSSRMWLPVTAGNRVAPPAGLVRLGARRIGIGRLRWEAKWRLCEEGRQGVPPMAASEKG
jgi:hypothetical protein